MVAESPFLRFDFKLENDSEAPYIFYDPVDVIETNQPEEVEAIFSKVEEAVANGYYAAGCVSYEAAPAFNPNFPVHSQSEFPLVWFAIFERPKRRGMERADEDYDISEWTRNMSYEQYETAIRKIKTAIEAGETKQINYTSRLHAEFSGDDFTFYEQLMRNQQAGYSAYLHLGKYRILSASPELFFRVKDNEMTLKPMKGTAQRGRTVAEDLQLREALEQSTKDRLENEIIVDLMKKELQAITVPGSVHTPSLFEVASYPTVHQMTSEIKGKLKGETSLFEWFQALFPCGSITGSPKQKTMEYIAKLEKSSRSIYCGAIGFITPDGEAVFNVPIRTVLLDTETNTASYGVGGGITAKSEAEAEYEEMETKATLIKVRQPEFKLLESLLLDHGNYPLLAEHLGRVKNSAYYFNYRLNEQVVRDRLDNLRKDLPRGKYKVRLLVDHAGTVSAEASPAASLKEPIICTLAKSPVNSSDPFLYHKTTHRAVYEAHEKTAPEEAFSVLLWNEYGEITEFTTGNVVVKRAGKLYTPPIECGLLGGTFREQLLKRGIIAEAKIKKETLAHAEEIWFINSVRGWVRVNLIG